MNSLCKHGLEPHLCIKCPAETPGGFSPIGPQQRKSLLDKWVDGWEGWNQKHSLPTNAAELYACQHNDDIRTCLECAYIDGHILAQSDPPKTTVILGASGLVTTIWSEGDCVGAWYSESGRGISVHAGHVYTADRAKELGVSK